MNSNKLHHTTFLDNAKLIRQYILNNKSKVKHVDSIHGNIVSKTAHAVLRDKDDTKRTKYKSIRVVDIEKTRDEKNRTTDENGNIKFITIYYVEHDVDVVYNNQLTNCPRMFYKDATFPGDLMCSDNEWNTYYKAHNMSREPLVGFNGEYYTKFNASYIQSIIDRKNCNYIPYICDEIISILKKDMFPGSILSIFHPNSNVYKSIIQFCYNTMACCTVNGFKSIIMSTPKTCLLIPNAKAHSHIYPQCCKNTNVLNAMLTQCVETHKPLVPQGDDGEFVCGEMHRDLDSVMQSYPMYRKFNQYESVIKGTVVNTVESIIKNNVNLGGIGDIINEYAPMIEKWMPMVMNK